MLFSSLTPRPPLIAFAITTTSQHNGGGCMTQYCFTQASTHIQSRCTKPYYRRTAVRARPDGTLCITSLSSIVPLSTLPLGRRGSFK
ncbi:hypothetical protein E2C01_081595 [Portunus trituberculatus]|uniref:Uncharacterized protein n=1 Tax=Portunus trituberculatus TaxID=210409 RepID=A0A5B7IX09_PORTR|nr:hypothetical protein [Portunus trituberculatus]